MLEQIKSKLYFPLASYFRFFAKIRLKKWHPQVIVVTGSNGKTTLLHMLEAQFGDKAAYSHHANSSYGIPFDILDLHRKSLKTSEWLKLFLFAPINVFKKLPKEKYYIVEADADRPHEGKFLAEMLTPEYVLWVSTGRTHSMNFDKLVSQRKFAAVEEAIAYEYGYFLEYCKKLAIVDGDSVLQGNELERTKAKTIKITKEMLKEYEVSKSGTKYKINNQTIAFTDLLPQEVFTSIAMVKSLIESLDLRFDREFKQFTLPPGRGTILNGISDTTLIDSTYNGNLGSIKAMLAMYEKYTAQHKWVIIGDMKELGNEEKEEHETLAEILNTMKLDRIILIGKLVGKYTLPLINNKIAINFNTAPKAVAYLKKNLKGRETLLFKGSQSIYLEGIIEKLLENKDDRMKLPRQEKFWIGQRKKLGFDSE